MDAKEQFKAKIILEQINSKLGGEELQGLFEIISEAQKTIDHLLPQINTD